MVSQWRYDFSRHSVRNSGSPFLLEISRMTSSLRPGGTVSCSMSVTNPWRYLRLTRSATWSESVAMFEVLGCCGGLAQIGAQGRQRFATSLQVSETHALERPADAVVDSLPGAADAAVRLEV